MNINKYLLFTSAGDNCILLNHNTNKWWLSHKDQKNFDICLCFYGNDENNKNKIKEQCEYFIESKGGKFENLLKAYQSHNEILKNYDQIFVIDDDILINTLEINFVFKCIEYLDSPVIQPSLIDDKICRIDHPVTRQNKNIFAHISDFIEMNVPVFKAQYLFSFLDWLSSLNEPILKGAGMDYMYCHYFRTIKKDKFFIIDKVACINIRKNDEEREICKLQPSRDRFRHWDYLRYKYSIPIKNNIGHNINECPKELVTYLSWIS